MTDEIAATDADIARLDAYIDRLSGALGHADRVFPFRSYLIGTMLPGKRKSIEPMSARLDPENVPRMHQKLQHFIATSPWHDDAVLARVRDEVIPQMQDREPIQAWIVDDSGMPKKGKLSVGVAHQYCGQLGKQANCQVAVSLSIANSFASLPIAYQLYMPQAWLDDEHADKRKKCKVPVDIAFRTKPQIALEQISEALEADVPRGVVLADAAYGNNTAFRTGLTALSAQYSVNIQETTTAWPDGQAPLKPPRQRSKRGRKPIRIRHTRRRHPVRVRDLAHALPESAFKRISWREGTAKPLTSRFAATRVRPASGDTALSAPREYEWLLIEWPKDEKAPTKYWLSTMSEATPLVDLVTTSMLRWRIERDYQNLKQELGLGQYEGRSWQGFHHHATVCIAAYGFLLITQGGFSPGAVLVSDSRNLPYPTVSDRAALPARFVRHVAHSIATIRARVSIALHAVLPYCHACQQRPYVRNAKPLLC
jgi:SRSO17 transposase